MRIVRAESASDRWHAIQILARHLDMPPDEVVGDNKFDAFLILGGERQDIPYGIVLYKNWSSGDIEMVCAGVPGWVSRRVLKFVFDYPFKKLNCNRVTCLAHRKNKAMRDYLIRMGFKLEGTKRKAIDGKDCMIYGLLRSEVKWG